MKPSCLLWQGLVLNVLGVGICLYFHKNKSIPRVALRKFSAYVICVFNNPCCQVLLIPLVNCQFNLDLLLVTG